MNRPRRAFSLTEVLVSLTLMSFVLAAGGELYRSSVNMNFSSAKVANQSATVDSALALMRRDVWGCRGFQLLNPQTAFVFCSEGTISWSVLPDGILQREDASHHLTKWPGVASGWAFSTSGPWIVVSNKDYSGWQAQRMVSQSLLSGEAP